MRNRKWCDGAGSAANANKCFAVDASPFVDFCRLYFALFTLPHSQALSNRKKECLNRMGLFSTRLNSFIWFFLSFQCIPGLCALCGSKQFGITQFMHVAIVAWTSTFLVAFGYHVVVCCHTKLTSDDTRTHASTSHFHRKISFFHIFSSSPLLFVIENRALRHRRRWCVHACLPRE